MVKNKNNKQDEGLREVEEALTKTEQFLENHLNLVLYVVGGLVIVVLGFLGYQKYVVAPKNIEAQQQLFSAQNYFSIDSFDLALNGDGVTLGFLDIIDDFGSTKAANLSNYYAGICYLHLGEYESAIDHLKKFSTDDILLEPLAKSARGDAYAELGDYKKAISEYKAALAANENDFSSPIVLSKMGSVYEELGDTDNALSVYEQIKTDYPKSTEAANVEKNIARLKQ